MIERGEDSRFTIEARETFSVTRECLRQNFQSDVAIEAHIPRSIHLAHAASTHRLNDFVRTKT
jgi:hypothetical protein